MALGGEIDLTPTIKKAWSQGKTCYLPVVQDQRLIFVNYTPTSVMQKNAFGILEPVSGGLISPAALDLVIVPLVAFDKHGHRIGMGGGYYDRTFAGADSLRHSFLMGVAHRCQQIHDIRPEPWDVALDLVLTD